MTPIQMVVSEWHKDGFNRDSEKDMKELALQLYWTDEYREEVLELENYDFNRLILALLVGDTAWRDRSLTSITERIKKLTLELYDYTLFDMESNDE